MHAIFAELGTSVVESPDLQMRALRIPKRQATSTSLCNDSEARRTIPKASAYPRTQARIQTATAFALLSRFDLLASLQ